MTLAPQPGRLKETVHIVDRSAPGLVHLVFFLALATGAAAEQAGSGSAAARSTPHGS